MLRSLGSLSLALAIVGPWAAAGCKKTAPEATPAPDASASGARPSPSAPASALASAPATAREAQIPSMAAERFAPGKDRPQAVFPIEGALAVFEGMKIGRIVGETIEWTPRPFVPASSMMGRPIITGLHGRWPDQIDVLYHGDNGRAPTPTYSPHTGAGVSRTLAEGGTAGGGDVISIGRAGARTIFLGHEAVGGLVALTARGPRWKGKFQSLEQNGCKRDKDASPVFLWPADEGYKTAFIPAVFPWAINGLDSGTIVTAGTHCKDGRPFAEVWEGEESTSKLIDLGDMVKTSGRELRALSLWRGAEDSLWLYTGQGNPLLRYKGGQFTKAPEFPGKSDQFFVSQERVPHLREGQTIYRLDGDAWVGVARMNWPYHVSSMGAEGGTIWFSSSRYVPPASDEDKQLVVAYDGVFRLVPAPSIEMTEGCTTPFVFLYNVAAQNDRRFTFPSTRKALSSFAEVKQIELVEFNDGGYRLGAVVASKAQGEALIAHVNATMKDEKPRLICYSPKNPRKIAPGK